jgi:hypothetical protein
MTSLDKSGYSTAACGYYVLIEYTDSGTQTSGNFIVLSNKANTLINSLLVIALFVFCLTLYWKKYKLIILFNINISLRN